VRADARDDDPGRTGFTAPVGQDATRLHRLARVIAELGGADCVDAVVDIVVRHAAAATGASVASFMLRRGEQLELIGAHGMREGNERVWASFPIDGSTPAGEAARTGQPVILARAADAERRYPVLRGQIPAGRSIVCLPLRARSGVLGIIGLTFEHDWVPGAGEMEFLSTFADTCLQALRRIRAIERSEEQTRRLTFLAEASAELASSLDYLTTLRSVARLAVPGLGDWCAVQILRDEGAVTVAVQHVDPAKVAWAWQLQQRYPHDPDSPSGAANVMRTGVSEIYPEITDEMVAAAARDEEHLRLSRELGLSSALIVPLTARGRTLGAITLIYAESGRRYDEADLVVAEELGRRAGLAIDNAMLYSQAQGVAAQLQRAVLPDDLGAVEGWAVAAHCAPGGNAEVGGDFYDAMRLADGRLAVFIGDVMGHGVAAAAAMAQMRASVRAFCSIDPQPGSVVSKLDAMFERMAVAQLVSLVYAVLDASAGTVEFVNAGHYPPLVVAPDGRARFLEATPQRPLGVGGESRTTVSRAMAPGEPVLLYTDGLVERRGETIDLGLRRLADKAYLLAGVSPAEALAKLIAGLHGDSGGAGDDDVTALAVRART
jgi:serine phosphatase RsbU (regulator of sigma subunit)